MSDLVSRLRVLADDSRKVYGLHAADCAAAMDEAASHMELLEAAYKSSGSALAVIDGGFKNAVAEIERLRLTDAEREAVEFFSAMVWPKASLQCKARSVTLRGLLDRFSPIAKRESDSPQPIADSRLAALQALTELDEEMRLPRCTPNPHATPGEGAVSPEWTSRPYWVDPPSGWQYGFPRLYDPAKDGDMRAWMIRNGYPEHLANQGLACTFTTQTEDVG